MNIFTKITGLTGAINYEKTLFIYHNNNDSYHGISGTDLKKHTQLSFEKEDIVAVKALTSAIHTPL